MLSAQALLAGRSAAIAAALAAAKAALATDDDPVLALVGQPVRLTTTGHHFTVLNLTADGQQARVLDGRTTRYLPVALLRQVQAAGLLVPAAP